MRFTESFGSLVSNMEHKAAAPFESISGSRSFCRFGSEAGTDDIYNKELAPKGVIQS